MQLLKILWNGEKKINFFSFFYYNHFFKKFIIFFYNIKLL